MGKAQVEKNNEYRKNVTWYSTFLFSILFTSIQLSITLNTTKMTERRIILTKFKKG